MQQRDRQVSDGGQGARKGLDNRKHWHTDSWANEFNKLSIKRHAKCSASTYPLVDPYPEQSENEKDSTIQISHTETTTLQLIAVAKSLRELSTFPARADAFWWKESMSTAKTLSTFAVADHSVYIIMTAEQVHSYLRQASGSKLLQDGLNLSKHTPWERSTVLQHLNQSEGFLDLLHGYHCHPRHHTTAMKCTKGVSR